LRLPIGGKLALDGPESGECSVYSRHFSRFFAQVHRQCPPTNYQRFPIGVPHPANQSVHQLHNRPQVEAPAKQHPFKKTLLWQSAALALLGLPLDLNLFFVLYSGNIFEIYILSPKGSII
jgi:hypothetical protein